VKDFCFPEGIEVKRLQINEDPLQATKVLYSSKSLRESCFVFTLNANEEGQSDISGPLPSGVSSSSFHQETYPGTSSADKYFNCLCVVFTELISPY